MPASVRVFTFKAGLFAKLAHDLRLHVERFEIVLDGGKLHAWFEADSLRVDGVMRNDVLDPSTLSEHDKQRIQATIHDDILHAAAKARIEFTGEARVVTPTQLHIAGSLRLHGHEQHLEFDVRRRAGTLHGHVALTPSQFGIEPYKALAGAIRVQDRVLIDVEIELGDAELTTMLEKPEPVRFRPAL